MRTIIKKRIITLDDIDDIVKCLPQNDVDDAKRQLRKGLLQSFDQHAGCVNYGARKETEEEKAQVLEWRDSLRDLETDAFRRENLPENIKYFYKK